MEKRYWNYGATLTLALELFKKTIVANIGDSRTYKTAHNKLKQITDDDSVVWYNYVNGVYKKSDLRFLKNNNIVTRALGISNNTTYSDISINIISNDYDGIFLFSDGVTDVLDDNTINNIITKKNKDKVVDRIIDKTLCNDIKNITPGKDNTTVAAYIKR